MNGGPTIPDLFTYALATGPARPLLTYYDDATGERVELSVATTANWVAKTANMLQDSLGVGAGSLVHLSLPPHWAGAVWLLAAWSAGCTITAAADIGQHESAVVVVGPDVLARSSQAAGFGATGEEVVALSLRPLGGRFIEALPAGVIDFNAEVLGHGDHFSAWESPTAGSAALRSTSGTATHADLISQARHQVAGRELAAGARLLLTGDDAPLASALVVALVVDGSLVLLRDSGGGAVPEERLAAVAHDERVTGRFG